MCVVGLPSSAGSASHRRGSLSGADSGSVCVVGLPSSAGSASHRRGSPSEADSGSACGRLTEQRRQRQSPSGISFRGGFRQCVLPHTALHGSVCYLPSSAGSASHRWGSPEADSGSVCGRLTEQRRQRQSPSGISFRGGFRQCVW